jgi:hypothetical protein
VSLRVLVQFTAERVGPPTAAIPRSTVNFPRKAGQATLFSSLEYFVRAVGINPKLDREVAFGFGESAHVLHEAAVCGVALAAFRNLLHGLSGLIEELQMPLGTLEIVGTGLLTKIVIEVPVTDL